MILHPMVLHPMILHPMILHPMILHHSKFDTVCIIEKMHLYWLTSALPMFQSRLVTSLESIDKRLYSEHPHMIEPFLKMDNLHRNVAVKALLLPLLLPSSSTRFLRSTSGSMITLSNSAGGLALGLLF
jgi:hypothetical protein